VDGFSTAAHFISLLVVQELIEKRLVVDRTLANNHGAFVSFYT
jgi:hypothetical protein